MPYTIIAYAGSSINELVPQFTYRDFPKATALELAVDYITTILSIDGINAVALEIKEEGSDSQPAS